MNEEGIEKLDQDEHNIFEVRDNEIWYKGEDVATYALRKKVARALKFIRETLKPRNDVNQQLLGEYEIVLEDFLRSGNVDTLQRLREISARPTPEGAPVDYTDGTSLEFEGDHKSLSEFVLEIEDLVSEYRRI